MELCMAALLATAFAYRNVISLVCVGFVAIGMAAAPTTCARLWRVLVRAGLHSHLAFADSKRKCAQTSPLYLIDIKHTHG